jgi:hypothetical protein
MSQRGGRRGVDLDRGWLALAGAGLAAGLYALWESGKTRRPGAVGAHAWLVPIGQARQEAQWTRHAVGQSSEAKGR